ncbi:glycosyltransferase [Gemmobacter sp. JM10B15]|uniref:Glycosyltransferase n=2 Tax=Gemmobacter denitrificans TaxID=3123040 RepID=A0ABU8C170_9RHOB
MPPDISVVLVSFEMEQALQRSLMSLSRRCQLGLEGRRCEIIVIDNGSARMPQLTPPEGMEFRLLRASRPAPSPVGALNEGLALARAPLIGAWIDGARMASPGLLAACLAAAEDARDVVVTLNYRLGRPDDGVAPAERAAHDAALLAGIGWPAQGYGLFSIATAEQAGEQGPILESNALFLSRGLWAELGGFDPVFDEPGGGAANPDLLQRALAAPGTRLVRVTGEGTFHQYHGGTTSTCRESATEALKTIARRYAALRGQPLARIRQVGSVFASPHAPAPHAPAPHAPERIAPPDLQTGMARP